jgi:RimJ/RimL family protein N-acetyltransferase
MWALMDLADRGVHDPATMPFLIPWTDEPVPERHWNSARYYWGSWANWSVGSWHLPMIATVDGEAVGSVSLEAADFVSQRTVETGSWLGREFQGHGLGVEMRHAVLQLAFVGLGARTALSGAFWDNGASCGVSVKLGYETVGEGLKDRRGVPDRCLEFRLDRPGWDRVRRDDIAIAGLDAALPMFGL